MPVEMHAIHYKKEYSSIKVAKNFDDGLLILVYFLEVLTRNVFKCLERTELQYCLLLKFQLKSNHNPVLHRLLSKLQYIQKADTKIVIEPFPIDVLITPFTSDYYTYNGSIATSIPTPVIWLITRKVTAISPEQV